MNLIHLFSKKEKESLKKSLLKTQENIYAKISRIFGEKSTISEDILDHLEKILISSDVGVETTLKIVHRVKYRIAKDRHINITKLNTFLIEEISSMLQEGENCYVSDKKIPYVIVVVGVNGVGKTTTVGKLAFFYKKKNQQVLLGAADTFRPAATEQLEVWSKRVGVPIIKQKLGNNPASVVYNTLTYALAHNVDVVIIDTAGRLHNKIGLMNELSKINRVIQKIISIDPHEVLLVLDGSTGQNALNQAKEFSKVTSITTLAITKLDGTAKGGSVIGISDQLHIPIKYIGIGERLEDLQIFRKKEFVNSLFCSF